MRNVLIFPLFLFFSGCCFYNYLCSGDQISAYWNGRYIEEGTGNAYINVGNKEVTIRDIAGIPSGRYQVHKIIENDELFLKAWLEYNGSYLSFQMKKESFASIHTDTYLNDLVTTIPDSFPQNFIIQLVMLAS